MTIYSGQFTLGTAVAVKIVPAESTIQEVHVHCATKQGNPLIYVGGSSISASNGMHVEAGETLTVSLPAGDDLWAVASAADTVAGVLRVQF